MYSLCIASALALSLYGLNYYTNERMISKVQDNVFTTNQFAWLGFMQPWIEHYNNGISLQHQKLYEEAIEEYDKALDSNIPWEDACWVRINKVLSMIAPIVPEAIDLTNIDDTINLLKDCQVILTEDYCATEDGEGHDEDAQQLYDDITEWIEELEKQKEEMEQEEEEEQQQEQQDQQDQQNDGQDQNQDQQNEGQDQNQNENGGQDGSQGDDQNDNQSDGQNGDQNGEQDGNQDNQNGDQGEDQNTDGNGQDGDQNNNQDGEGDNQDDNQNGDGDNQNNNQNGEGDDKKDEQNEGNTGNQQEGEPQEEQYYDEDGNPISAQEAHENELKNAFDSLQNQAFIDRNNGTDEFELGSVVGVEEYW